MSETIAKSTEDTVLHDSEMIAPVSEEYIEDPVVENGPDLTAAGGLRNPNRAGVYALDYLSAGINRLSEAMTSVSDKISDARDNVGNRRTASELAEDTKVSAQEKYSSAKIKARTIGRSIISGGVRVMTTPARAGESLANKMNSGMNKLEQRAQTAQERKEERQSDRAEYRAQKAEAKQIQWGEKRADQINKNIAKADAKQMRLGEKLSEAKNRELSKTRAQQEKWGEKRSKEINKELVNQQRQEEKQVKWGEKRADQINKVIEKAKKASARKEKRKALYASIRERGKDVITSSSETIRKTGRGMLEVAGVGLYLADEATERVVAVAQKKKEQMYNTGKGIIQEARVDYHTKRAETLATKAEKHRQKI